MSLDALEFRKALGAYPTGVTVVTTKDPEGVPRGFTANSFTSVSLTPPLVLVCLAKAAHSHEVFTGASTFAVNVLAETQKAVSSLFASKQADKFESCQWHTGTTGAPLIDGAVARFDCRTHQCVDAGDHTILIGEVQGLHHAADERPLGYCRGAYTSYQSEQLLVAATASSSRVGALIETSQGVVLLQDAHGCRLGNPDRCANPVGWRWCGDQGGTGARIWPARRDPARRRCRYYLLPYVPLRRRHRARN
jgi:flavin reductase (DIM6/NTAB) family NADH-FMN oxidoreductase RutF